MIHPRGRLDRRWRVIVVLCLGVAMAGHLYFWYWPRSRQVQPDPASEVARLALAESGLEARIWLPYPHQNLRYLERRLGDLGSIGSAWRELSSATAPMVLPAFGPFALPPASEMAVATDRDGDRFVAMARVYPSAAWLFRVAGRLAGNPWLAGGELDLGGRQVRVEWIGNVWTARTATVDRGDLSGVSEIGPSLMLLRWPALPEPVPAGPYRLHATDGPLELTSSLSAEGLSRPSSDPSRWTGAALSWIRLEATPRHRSVRSLVALSGGPRGRSDLPRLLLIESSGSESWTLPGERVLTAVGAEVHSRDVEAWRLRSYDPSSLERGEELLAGLDALMREPRRAGVEWFAHVDVGEAARILESVGETIGQVPILGEREAGRWLAYSRLLANLSGVSGLSLRLAEPADLAIRFVMSEDD